MVCHGNRQCLPYINQYCWQTLQYQKWTIGGNPHNPYGNMRLSKCDTAILWPKERYFCSVVTYQNRFSVSELIISRHAAWIFWAATLEADSLKDGPFLLVYFWHLLSFFSLCDPLAAMRLITIVPRRTTSAMFWVRPTVISALLIPATEDSIALLLTRKDMLGVLNSPASSFALFRRSIVKIKNLEQMWDLTTYFSWGWGKNWTFLE